MPFRTKPALLVLLGPKNDSEFRAITDRAISTGHTPLPVSESGQWMPTCVFQFATY